MGEAAIIGAGLADALDDRTAGSAKRRRLPGRPRQFDPDKALAAALRVFWTHGYEGTSVSELTQAMGINRPSLYAVFGNKEALFCSALELYERQQLAYVSGALAAPTSRQVVERLLRGALKAYCSATGPKGCLGVISSIAGGADTGSVREHVLSRRVSSDALLVDRFERARQQGDIPSHFDPTALARLVWAIMQGVAVQAGGGVTRAELSRMIETGLKLWPTV